MGNLLSTIPFTELYERLMTMARIDTFNNVDFAKGTINDVYRLRLPALDDWKCLIRESSISCSAYYNTGTVAINAASTSLTGTGTVWTSGMTAANGWRIKFAGNDNVYTFTYVSATTATISPALSGADNLSGASYELVRDEYELASDFDRFLKNGSVYVYSGGRVQSIIEETERSDWRGQFQVASQDPIKRVMLTEVASSGNQLVRLNPGPRTAKNYPYEYIKQISPMSDYSTGTVSVTNGSAVVTGSGTYWAANAAAGDYLRVDATGKGDSSKWYKILSVDGNTQVTLASNYSESTESGAMYTVSKAPTAYPARFHEFILYEATLVVMGEQSDSVVKLVAAKREEILADLRKLYKSRRTNVQIGVEDDGYR